MFRVLLSVILASFLFSFVSAQQDVTVAKDGTGKYSSVQQAFDAIAPENKKPITIYIKNGIYKEKLHLDSSKNFITIIGEDKFKTILTYDDHTGKVTRNGDTINTRTSASFLVLGDYFTAENVTIQNDAGFTAGQAVALESDGDKAQFFNCRLIGFQDVLFTNNELSRQYYKDCYIEGATDFIFGSATVWFERCHIHSKKNSHVTAASTPKDHPFGYVFDNCILTGDSSLRNVSLGRPWRPFASVIYMHCFFGPQIKPEGWRNWNKTDNYKTTRFSEYENYGPGAEVNARVSWSVQLNDADANKLTISNVFDGWQPKDCNFKM
ncbi:MAG: pectinesterase family protein [Bacteroidota bacterium]|nr:pectinesterase family protein [Bacteroidota bacterium]